MLEPWILQLDAHERTLADAATRGRQPNRTGSTGRRPTGQDRSASPGRRPTRQDRSTSRGTSQTGSRRRSRSSSESAQRHSYRRRKHRRRSPSPSDSSSDSNSSDNEAGENGKRRKLDPSLFDWEVNQTIQNAVLSPAHLAVQRRYENFSTDPKECLRLIKNSHPPPFTDAGFRAIVYSTPVNFDEVLSYFRSPSVSTSTTHSLGNGLIFQTSNTTHSHKVVDRDSWRFAWVRYERVLNHIFNSRQAELETYYEYIQNIFDHRHSWLDPQIITFDKACRALIASARGRILFSDVQQFSELKESHFQASGLAYMAPTHNTSGSGSRDGGKSKKRRKEICRNWNNGRCTADDCRYRHICSSCKSSDHTNKSCPNRNSGKSV
ncbi:hypothetical protein EDD18DRAFT_1091641 [Armillaria luteobubalina]|uniref:C3H1-type domain-containing protein n=1 Tax=Armillaria luteobubalina TaxID=153913 RepID=A0AA39NY09_9AGAR|nr:hypothetical protein EDD18DRAFT_1091641 [Armillaria luteobubalina]